MIATYTEKAKQRTDHFPLLQHATKLLEDIAAHSSEPIVAAWDRQEDQRGQTLYTLKLSDLSGAVSASYDLDDLANPRKMRSDLRELWGDLLQARSQKNVKKLLQLAEQLRAEGD